MHILFPKIVLGFCNSVLKSLQIGNINMEIYGYQYFEPNPKKRGLTRSKVLN